MHRQFARRRRQERIRLRGEHAISRQTTAQGRPGVSGSTCVSSVHHCASVQHRGHGCRPAPGLPCALFMERVRRQAKLGQNMPRECGVVCIVWNPLVDCADASTRRTRFNASLRGAKRRSNPGCRGGGILDCFASLAMTEKGRAPKSITLMVRRRGRAGSNRAGPGSAAFIGLHPSRLLRRLSSGRAAARTGRKLLRTRNRQAIPSTLACLIPASCPL